MLLLVFSDRLLLLFSSCSFGFFSGLSTFFFVDVVAALDVEGFLTVVDRDDFLATGEDTLRALAELLTAFLRRASAS